MAAVLQREKLESFAVEPRAFLWSGDEYERLTELGFFQGRRVEYIAGEIVEMAAMANTHWIGLMKTRETLRRKLTDGVMIFEQVPIVLPDASQPEPDFVVARGTLDDFAGNAKEEAARRAVLVVEISDATLNYDRTTKAALYADGDIPEYLIVNLQAREIEVLREPKAGKYACKIVVKASESIAPIAAPETSIAVVDLLP